MEGSFAKELYSESMQLSKLELTPPGDDESNFDDKDGSLWGDSDEELHKSSDLDREWQRRRDQFHTIGYRDGLIAGKEAIAQEGFNNGFKQSVLVGYDWGLVRGVTSAYACLPDGLKEKLIRTREKRNKFQALYESVHSISTTDALKSFHDDILSNKAAGPSEHAMASSSDEAGLQTKISDCSLGNYVGELQSLLLESPAVDSHLSGPKHYIEPVSLFFKWLTMEHELHEQQIIETEQPTSGNKTKSCAPRIKPKRKRSFVEECLFALCCCWICDMCFDTTINVVP